MEVTKGTVAILAAACITAGAAGTYLATQPGTPAAAAEPSLEAALALDASDAAVEASEGVILDAPAPVAVLPAPALERPAAAVRETLPSPRRSDTPAAVAPALPPVAAPAPAAASTSRPESVIASAPPAAPVEVLSPPPALEVSRAVEEPARVEPPPPAFHDLVLPDDAVIGLQVESTVSSETAAVEDQVVARVVRDVKVGDHVAIPAGSKARGEVTLVDKGGRVRGRARLGVRFTSIVLADGTTVPIATETIYREGGAPGRESTAKIGGGAIGGAIIGGILGGAKGAAIGGGIGAGAGSAAVLADGRNPAVLSPGSPVTIRLQAPATVTVER